MNASTNTPMSFEAWLDDCIQELDCIAAETGADREADFNREDFEQAQYTRYTTRFHRHQRDT